MPEHPVGKQSLLDVFLRLCEKAVLLKHFGQSDFAASVHQQALNPRQTLILKSV